MFDFTTIPSTSKLLSTYASAVTTIMVIRTIANQLIPRQLQTYIYSYLQKIIARFFASPRRKLMTIVVDEYSGYHRNQIFDATEMYLCSQFTTTSYSSSSMDTIKVTKTPRDKNLSLGFASDQPIIDIFNGIQLKWRLVHYQEGMKNSSMNVYRSRNSRWFELNFEKEHQGIVLDSYFPHVLKESKALKEENKVLKLYTRGQFSNKNHEEGGGGGGGMWGSIKLEHPATFDKLAMEPDLKKALIDDLDRFLERREFYRRVGKAWKRGYLLYGPPGTGKSSLIAAMANYLQFDIYDLELAGLYSNSRLRDLLVSTTNRSILVIEDIDCSIGMEDRRNHKGDRQSDQLTLSGLLNIIDGLWSSCGDERIIVFTTNYKDRLDPALLRPGRMDMHILMSYCTPSGFKILASNYLGICDHPLFKDIEWLIEEVEVTPAEVAEELMKSDDVEVSLHGLISFMHRKNMEYRAKAQEKVHDDEERIDDRKVTKDKKSKQIHS